MAHKFRVHQKVRYLRSGPARMTDGDTYEVIRLMPEDQSGEPAYRIKSRTGERAVRESELSVAGG